MTKKAREKLKSEINKYSKDDKAYEVYTKLSHQEIIRNGKLNSARKEGLLEEAKQEKLEIAKRMLEKNMDIKDIMEITWLSKSDIEHL